MKEKMFFDSNIFIYAADKKSLFHNESVEIIKDSVEVGFFTSDLCFLEFYQVITDGRKTPRPLSPEKALLYIQKLWSTPEIDVLEADILGAFEEKEHQNNLVRYNVTRFAIYDYLIAACLKKNKIRKIVTFNSKDFKKYPWLTVVDPRETYGSKNVSPSVPSAMLSAPRAMRMIPYGRQSIDEQDVAAVCSVLRSDWLTTGPKVAEFEQAVADYVGAKYAVAVSSGTAALHAAMYAIGIGSGDEVIVPPITFAATANCIVFQGGTPVFADVILDTLLIDPAQVEAKITPRTKAIIAVDFAGQPCEYDRLRDIAGRNALTLVADGCHAIGAEYKGRKVGSLADMTVFRFHPAKHITTGEGGMITTDDEALANRMRLFRNHGITRDPKQFAPSDEVSAPSALRSRLSAPSSLRPAPCALPFYYEMVDLGYNYRITDFQCALGISQLRKLSGFLERRREIAALYDKALSAIPGIEPLGLRADVLTAAQSAKREAQSEDRPSPSSSDAMRHAPCAMRSSHAYHLYVVKIDFKSLGIDRTALFTNLREKGVGVNVHYIPVHLHPFYREKFHTGPGLCPVAETAYEQIISLPMFPGMTDEDVEKVIGTVKNIVMK
jgi:perosamine synthetase